MKFILNYRGGYYGNGYPSNDDMLELEREMWSLGTGEPMENKDGGKHSR